MLTRLRAAAADVATARRLADRLADPEQAPGPALATSLFEHPASGCWQVDAYYDEAPDLAAILATVGELLLESPPATLEAVPDENWVAVSQAALPPVAAGRFLVHGSHDRSHVGRRHLALEIDAGEAFGTAHHATTEGCLEALDRLARRWAPRRVLDLGCGSGVLAIAAARVWPAARVTASDIDPVAVAVARENVRLNRAAARVHLVTAPGLGHREIRRRQPFDLVLANILAGPLVRLAPGLARCVAPGGRIVLSGLLAGQAREVAATYRMAGFVLAERRILHGWATLVLRRRMA